MAAAFADQAVTNNTPAPEPAPKKLEASDEPATLNGPTAPTGSAVSCNELTLTFNRDLAAVDGATAATLRWYFLVDGANHQGTAVNRQSPNQVAVDGATLTLTLGTAIAPGDDVTVTYYGGLRRSPAAPQCRTSPPLSPPHSETDLAIGRRHRWGSYRQSYW